MCSWCNTCKSWRSSFQWMIERTFPHKQSATVFDVVFLTIKKCFLPFLHFLERRITLLLRFFLQKGRFFRDQKVLNAIRVLLFAEKEINLSTLITGW